MLRRLKRWSPTRDDRGVTTVEYGIVAAFIGIAAIGGFLAIRDAGAENYQQTTAGTGVCITAGCDAYGTLPAAAIPGSGALTLSGYSSVSATRNVPIASQSPIVGGGSSPYSYSISPAVPTGLTFNTGTGLLSGTPTTAQASTPYVVTVTDNVGATATQGISISVTAPSMTLTGYSSISGTTGTAITSQTPTPSGGTAPYTYGVSPALPSGLSLNASTGVLSGTPGAAQTSSGYTITATDSLGATASQIISITVSTPLSLTGYSNISGTTGVAITSQSPIPSGGAPSYSYGISPAVPAGMGFSAGGVLSGTPTAYQSSTTYTVTVTDSVGTTATQSFTIALTNPTCAANQILIGGACAATPPITLCYTDHQKNNPADYLVFAGYSYGSSRALTSVSTPTPAASGTATILPGNTVIRYSAPNNTDAATNPATMTFAFQVSYDRNGSTVTGTGTGSLRVERVSANKTPIAVTPCP